jgi:hypothetical protein
LTAAKVQAKVKKLIADGYAFEEAVALIEPKPVRCNRAASDKMGVKAKMSRFEGAIFGANATDNDYCTP